MSDKPEKTDFIAMHGYGWAAGDEADQALLRSLSHISHSDTARLKGTLKVNIYETSEDWKVYDHGSLTATYVELVATADLTVPLISRAKDLMETMTEAVEWKE